MARGIEMRKLALHQLQNWHPYVFFKDEFTPSECAAIIHEAKFRQPVPGFIGVDDGHADEKVRSSELRWVNEQENTKWIYDRLEAVCTKVRTNWYPFVLTQFKEPLQITHYKAEKAGHYDWHQDFGPGEMSTRKLSIVVLLNDPAEFKGGELEIMGIPGDSKTVKEIAQGTVIAFPSWEFHRVQKLTEGERWSLVSWVHGPLFT
jgi:PKHD-type hydroxylase